MTGISDLQTIFGGAGSTRESSEAAGASPAGSRSTRGGTDSATLNSAPYVSVSSTAGALAQMATDDVRTEKVAQIKEAIDKGTYNVSSTAVADKLIGFMQDGQ